MAYDVCLVVLINRMTYGRTWAFTACLMGIWLTSMMHKSV